MTRLPTPKSGQDTAHGATEDPDVLTERHGGVLLITLNRPSRLNAINEGLARGLGEALQVANTDPGINAVVIAASGRAFCAGMDLDAFRDQEPIVHPDYPEWGIAGITQHTVAVPVIAAVHGVAAGGGFEVALCADLIIAEESARFALPEIKLGLFAAAGGLLRLPIKMPHQIANELAYTGRFVGAGELARWGVVNRVVPTGDVLGAALEVASAIADSAPRAVRATKELMSLASLSAATADSGWAANARLMGEVFATDDAREGVAAFQEKRSARWTGH